MRTQWQDSNEVPRSPRSRRNAIRGAPAPADVRRELTTFLIIGGLITVLDIVVFNVLLLGVGTGPVLSKVVSITFAAVASYAVNRCTTWRGRSRTAMHRELGVFLAICAAALVVNEVPVVISHYLLGLTSPMVDNVSANVVGLPAATIFRFWAFRRWVFPPAPEQVDVPVREPIAA